MPNAKMTTAVVKNLKIWIAQLIVTEAFVIYPAVRGNDAITIHERILAPISLLVAPIWAVRQGEYAIFLLLVLIDVAFLSIMIFSLVRNHRIVGVVRLFLFNFLCVSFIAAGI